MNQLIPAHKTPEALRHDAQLALQARLALGGVCAEGAAAWSAGIVALLEEVELRTICVAYRGGEAGDYVMAELVHIARRRHARQLIADAEIENDTIRKELQRRWRHEKLSRRGDRLRKPRDLQRRLPFTPDRSTCPF